ncbi:hypothetical protein V5O48_016224, partial [Marasmius crinis-equi]
LGWNTDPAFMRYGKQLSHHRKTFQRHLGVKETLGFDHVIAEEARLLAIAGPGTR